LDPTIETAVDELFTEQLTLTPTSTDPPAGTDTLVASSVSAGFDTDSDVDENGRRARDFDGLREFRS
jgi:hypothetical protein